MTKALIDVNERRFLDISEMNHKALGPIMVQRGPK